MKQSITTTIKKHQALSLWGGCFLGMAMLAGLLQVTGLLQELDKASLGQAFRWRRHSKNVSAPITLVTLTEKDLQRLDQWPLEDQVLADLLQRLQQAQPSVIGLNLYRDRPIGQGYQQLVRVLQSQPPIIGVEKIVQDDSGQSVNALPELKSLNQVAASDVVVDRDGVLRRHLLSLADHDGKVTSSIGLRLALEYLAQRGITPRSLNDGHGLIRLGESTIQPLVGSTGGYVRMDAGGYQILSNFYYQHPEQLTRVSLSAVLAGDVPAEVFRDRMVLIGITAASLQPQFHAAQSLGSGRTWYGIELQADLAAQIVTAATQGRLMLKGALPWQQAIWILFSSGVGATIGWSSSQPNQPNSLWTRGFGWTLLPIASLLLLASSYGLFLSGWWIVVSAPMVALWGSALLSQRLRLWQELGQARKQLSQSADTLAQHNQVLVAQAQATQSLQLQMISLTEARAEAEQASQSKSEFIFEMGHELRNPLNAILGFSEVAEKDAVLPAPYRKSLSVIHNSSKHLLALVNSLFEFANLGVQPSQVNPRQIDLRFLVQNIEALLQPQAAEKKLKLQCRVDDQLPDYLWLDDTKLRQVLINLLGNAIKFTHRGHILLRIWCERKSSPLRSENPTVRPIWLVHFVVEDTGPGLSLAQRQRIFASGLSLSTTLAEPVTVALPHPPTDHEMGSKSRTIPSSGLGLGLPISRNLIQRMGGDLQLTSRTGEGTRFYFALTLETAPSPHKAAQMSSTVSLSMMPRTTTGIMDSMALTGKPGCPKGDAEEPYQYRLLVVDDSAVNRALLVQLLQDLALDVKEAANGEAAIALWQAWKPDLILMDMQMPMMDGCQATAAIRQLEADTLTQTPIIAITADASAGPMKAAIQAGCNAVLPKPFRRSEVLSQVMDALSQNL